MKENRENWLVEFTTIDWLNPQFGYSIKIMHEERTVLFTSQHPVTGQPLSYKDCLEVAAMYGPKIK